RAAGLGGRTRRDVRVVRVVRRTGGAGLAVVDRPRAHRGRVRVRARDRHPDRPVPGEPCLLHRERLRRHRAVRVRARRPGGAVGSAGAVTRTPWIVGVSGASGTPYAASVLRGLFDAGAAVDLVVSRAARLTMLDETGLSFRDAHWRSDLSTWLGREPGD